MGAFGKVYSGPQFTHLEGGTVGLTEFRGPFQMWGSPFTSFPAPFQDHFLHNSQRYACGYIYLYIYVFILKHTLNYISCFSPNPCASQTFNRIKFLALVYKPAVMPRLPLLGAPPSPPALFCHNGLLVPQQAKRFPACPSLFALLFLCGIHIPQLFSRPVPHLSGVSSESASSTLLSRNAHPHHSCLALSQQALGSFLAQTVT